MRECKHRWAIRNGSPALLGDLDSKSQEVFCLKCGKAVDELLDEKDRQLDAGARDIIEIVMSGWNRCHNCPNEDCIVYPTSDECRNNWRKRWERISNDK